MGISIIDHPSIEVTLPVYKLSGTPVVLLPGILYKVNFKSQDAVNLLNFYKKNPKVNNLLISNLSIPKSFKQTPGQLSQDSIEGSRTFRKFLNGNQDDENAYDWLILGVIPQNGNKNLTISRIVGVVKGQKGDEVTLTFQALTRGEILDDVEVGITDIKEFKLKVYSNALRLGELLNSKVEDYTKRVANLFKTIDNFLNDFLIATSIEKSSKSQGKNYALTLSPLANALNVQFSNDYKLSSIKLKKLIERYVSTFDQYGNKRNTEQFLKILDLTVAILPIGDKLEFLSKTNVFERFEEFERIIEQFEELFKTLYQSVDYVDKFYTNASDLEKSKIISSQLKSIRFLLDAIKPKSSGPGISGPNSGDSDDQNDEHQLISNFVSNFPFDVNEDGKKLITKDFKRLKKMPQQHSEYQVLRTYFDVIMDIPFGKYVSLSNVDINKVSKQLDEDHYGLYHVKKRLLQYLSVLKLHEKNNSISSASHIQDEELIIGQPGQELKAPNFSKQQPKIQSKSPILLFVGPPGVGKTSLAKSIAQALGRKFQRVSLGGIRDESEIRGHRRTYVGSLPGVIINALRKSGSMNPLILLDEIDKVCGGANSAGRVNGDPEAALLEVLDPEQNWSFSDHYIGFPVDLSNVLFLCTANELSTISAPLRDRMEVIEISGYTFDEKVKIGEKHLLPKQVRLNGLPKDSVRLSKGIWDKIVQEYIREAGVRNLERKIASICRGKAVEYVEDEPNYSPDVELQKLVKYLGLPNHPISKSLLEAPKYSKPQGVVNGLSYNSDGSGGVLVFEVVAIPTSSTDKTSPTLILTGRLGETLTESIKIGLTFIKSMISRNLLLNYKPQETLKRFNNSELHLHVPMGSIPKDGPSAGITITLALLSIALNKPVDGKFAMTGEITLRGKVLPIGGISEKLLGASQFGIKTVLVPKLNRKDIIETFYSDDDSKLIEFLNDDNNNAPELKVKKDLGLDIIYVDNFFDVIKAVWQDVNIDENLANLISNHL